MRFCRVPRALPWAFTTCPVGAGHVVTGKAPTGHNLIAQGIALEIIAHGIAQRIITGDIARGMIPQLFPNPKEV